MFLRLQNGIFCAALLIALLVSRRYRECLEAVLLLAAAGVAYGAVDLLSWRDWFHSGRVYLLFNLRGGADEWGGSCHSPAYYSYMVVDKDNLAANLPPPEAYLVKRDHDWSLFGPSSSFRLTAPPNGGL